VNGLWHAGLVSANSRRAVGQIGFQKADVGFR
jgi:hypothetical protein